MDYNKTTTGQNTSNSNTSQAGMRTDGDLREDLRNVKDSLSQTAQHAKDKAADLYHDAKEKGVDLQENIIVYVKANPVKALGFALLTGFLAATLLRG